jgi:hypothetical protein
LTCATATATSNGCPSTPRTPPGQTNLTTTARLIATVRQAADLDKAEALAHRLVEYALADTGR